MKLNTAAVLDVPEPQEPQAESLAEAQAEAPEAAAGSQSEECPFDTGLTHSAKSLGQLCDDIDNVLELEPHIQQTIRGDLFRLCKQAGISQYVDETTDVIVRRLKDRRFDLGIELEKLAREEEAELDRQAIEEEAEFDRLHSRKPSDMTGIEEEPESDAEILARLAREWDEKNVELEHEIARLGVEILRVSDKKKSLDKDRKELTEELDARLSAGPPKSIPMHQRPLPFDAASEGEKGESEKNGSGQEAVATEPPDLDWSLDGEDVYIAESRHVFTDPVDELNYTPRALLWAIEGDDEAGYLLNASHERLLVDTGLVGVKFATMEDAQKAAAVADHSHAKPAAISPGDAPAVVSDAPADPNAPEDLRWRDVKLAKWPKPHNLAAGTLKMLEEEGLVTLGDVTDRTKSKKPLTDIKGFGEGKLTKFEECETAFWARWKRDPEKVIREEV